MLLGNTVYASMRRRHAKILKLQIGAIYRVVVLQASWTGSECCWAVPFAQVCAAGRGKFSKLQIGAICRAAVLQASWVGSERLCCWAVPFAHVCAADRRIFLKIVDRCDMPCVSATGQAGWI